MSKSGDLVIPVSAIRHEGTSREYAPIEYPATADFTVVTALIHAADELKYPWHARWCTLQGFVLRAATSRKKNAGGYELMSKWDAWRRLGVLAGEMESAALTMLPRSGACRNCFASHMESGAKSSRFYGWGVRTAMTQAGQLMSVLRHLLI